MLRQDSKDLLPNPSFKNSRVFPTLPSEITPRWWTTDKTVIGTLLGSENTAIKTTLKLIEEHYVKIEYCPTQDLLKENKDIFRKCVKACNEHLQFVIRYLGKLQEHLIIAHSKASQRSKGLVANKNSFLGADKYIAKVKTLQDISTKFIKDIKNFIKWMVAARKAAQPTEEIKICENYAITWKHE